jgi:nucleoside-diphosphate-sugar epimerase
MTVTLSREHVVVRNASGEVRPGRSRGSRTGRAARGGNSAPGGGGGQDLAGGAGADGTADTGRHRDDAAASTVAATTPAGPADRYPAVAVTGAARGIGRALITRLAASPRIGKVVAIDDHRGDVAGVTWRVADVRDPALAGRLAGVDVVVHADLDLEPDSEHRARRAFNVRGAQTVLTAAAAGRVGRVILVTSAMVYGARADNQVPLPEDAPLTTDVDSSVAGDLLEIEQLARRSPRTHPGMELTVVRPAALVGDDIDTIVTRHFEAPRLLTVKGCAPRWQFCHIDDLVSALELAVNSDVTGEFAVGCDGWLDQDAVQELSGLRGIELPAGLTFGTAQRLHRVGVTPAPATDLRFVVYPWVVDCATLRDAGWRPKYGNEDALRALLDVRVGHHAVAGRRITRKEATITAAGAAGAAGAVIGTAAIVRMARRRRKSGT